MQRWQPIDRDVTGQLGKSLRLQPAPAASHPMVLVSAYWA